jgi:hypothetical protein
LAGFVFPSAIERPRKFIGRALVAGASCCVVADLCTRTRALSRGQRILSGRSPTAGCFECGAGGINGF